MPRWKKKVNIIKYFIEHGADIMEKKKKEKKKKKKIKILIKMGVKKKKKKKKRRSGDTPLGYLMSKRK